MEFISHCIKRDPRKLEYRATFGMLMMLVVLSLLGWIYLTQASHVATTSRRIQELQAEKAHLERQNMELMVKAAELESVDRLDRRAQELGFVAATLDQADFVMIADLPPDPGQATDQVADQALMSRSGSDGSGRVTQAANPVWSSSLASDPGLVSNRWLDGVTAQFTAWVQSETQ